MGSVYIPIEEGYEVEALAGRVIAKGLCSYKDLVDGSLTIKDFFRMLRIADWQDYAEGYVQEASRNS